MTIQNQLEAAKYSLFIRIVIAVIPFIGLLLIFMEGKSDIMFLSIMLGVLTIIYLAILIRWPHYFWFSDLEKDIILIRYYNVHVFLRKPKQLKIKKGTIKEYKINSIFNGWRKEIIITVITPNGLAQYAPINISLLNEQEVEKLKKSLDSWKKR